MNERKEYMTLAAQIPHAVCGLAEKVPVFCFWCSVSCVLFPVSCFLCSVSCVLFPVSCVLFPVSCFLCSVSCVLFTVFCFLDVQSPSWNHKDGDWVDF